MLEQMLESAASSYAFFCGGPVPKLPGGSKCAFYLSCHLHGEQLSSSQQPPPPPPAASGSSHPPAWVRAGRPPLPLGSPGGCLHHIPPWSVAHARGRARGSGARGCACIARLLLAAHTVHGSEGASEGGTGPSAAPAAPAASYPVLAPRAVLLPPRSRDPLAGLPPPLSPRAARCSRRRGPHLVFARLPHLLGAVSAPAACGFF